MDGVLENVQQNFRCPGIDLDQPEIFADVLAWGAL